MERTWVNATLLTTKIYNVWSLQLLILPQKPVRFHFGLAFDLQNISELKVKALEYLKCIVCNL